MDDSAATNVIHDQVTRAISLPHSKKFAIRIFPHGLFPDSASHKYLAISKRKKDTDEAKNPFLNFLIVSFSAAFFASTIANHGESDGYDRAVSFLKSP